MDLRDDTLRQGPPFHISLVLHVLDLLLQCVLVHVSEYTGIHGYSRASLLPDKSRIALAPLRKINRTGYVWGLLLLEHQTYVTDWQQEIRFCEEKCTNFSLVATSARWQRIPILFLVRTWRPNRHRADRSVTYACTFHRCFVSIHIRVTGHYTEGILSYSGFRRLDLGFPGNCVWSTVFLAWAWQI